MTTPTTKRRWSMPKNADDDVKHMVHQLMKQGDENPKTAEVVRARTYWVKK